MCIIQMESFSLVYKHAQNHYSAQYLDMFWKYMSSSLGSVDTIISV